MMTNPRLYLDEDDLKKDLAYCGEGVKFFTPLVWIYPNKCFVYDNVRVDPFTLISTVISIGSYTQIMKGSSIIGGSYYPVTLKGWNFIGYNSLLITSSEDYSGEYGPVNYDFNPNNKLSQGDIVFEKFAGVASNCTVGPNITLPKGVCLGLDSTYFKQQDLEEFTIYKGKFTLEKLKKRNQEKIEKEAQDLEQK